MDIQSNQETGDYLQSNGLKVQTLKNLITQILFSNTAYDCMPINSSISSIDKSVPLYDAINILITENIDQLLVWDQAESKWIWMLTIVDAIRLIMHSVKSIIKFKSVNFNNFQQQDLDITHLQFQKYSSTKFRQNLDQMIQQIKKKSLGQVINEIGNSTRRSVNKITGQNLETKKPYIRLKSVVKQSKLSYIILTMIVEKIHRILIQDIESKMMISIINFKDILLYLLRIANESPIYHYNKIPIGQLLQAAKLKNIEIDSDKPLWQAFNILTDIHRSLWINVVDPHEKRFCGMLFRQDFRNIFQGWNLNYLWMSTGQFIKLKNSKYNQKIPQFRFFDQEQTTKDIIWKIVMTRRNAITCIDKNNGRVISTIGLMELFNLYVQ